MEPQGLGCKTFTEIQATPSPRISQAHLPLLGTLLSGMPSACLIFTVVSFVETWIPSIWVYPQKNDSANQKSQPPRDEVSVCWKAYWPNHHLALHTYHQNGGCSIAMYTGPNLSKNYFMSGMLAYIDHTNQPCSNGNIPSGAMWCIGYSEAKLRSTAATFNFLWVTFKNPPINSMECFLRFAMNTSPFNITAQNPTDPARNTSNQKNLEHIPPQTYNTIPSK